MTLSDVAIDRRMNGDPDIPPNRRLSIERPDGPLAVQPSSVDLHLGGEWLVALDAPGGAVDVGDESTYPTAVDTGSWTIPPREFRLATTQEYVDLPDDVVGFLWGRSSIGRLGLFVHNAGLVDAGFAGDLTLELFNAADYPIVLRPGMRIVQLTLHEHTDPPTTAYGDIQTSKYHDQRGVTPSKLAADFTGDGDGDGNDPNPDAGVESAGDLDDRSDGQRIDD